jgi:hypothetical protein
MTTAPVGQAYPVLLDQVAGNGPGQAQAGDVQRLGLGSASSKTPKRNASGPHATTLPSVSGVQAKKGTRPSNCSSG